MSDAARKVLGETWEAWEDPNPTGQPAKLLLDGGYIGSMSGHELEDDSVDHARARIAACAPEALRLLMEAEWSGYNGLQCCPWCDAQVDVDAGHKPDCRLVALLKKAGVRE